MKKTLIIFSLLVLSLGCKKDKSEETGIFPKPHLFMEFGCGYDELTTKVGPPDYNGDMGFFIVAEYVYPRGSTGTDIDLSIVYEFNSLYDSEPILTRFYSTINVHYKTFEEIQDYYDKTMTYLGDNYYVNNNTIEDSDYYVTLCNDTTWSRCIVNYKNDMNSISLFLENLE